MMFRYLRGFFHLNNVATDLRQAAVLDYYTGAVWWANELGFTEQKISAFFTAIYILLENIKGLSLNK